MLNVPLKHAQNNFVLNEIKLWSFIVKFVIVWLVMDVCYLTFFLASLFSSVMGFVTMRNKTLDICVMIVRATITTTIQITVLRRRGLFKDTVARLITGQLNRYEERPLLKTRMYRGLCVLVLSVVFILTLNLIEAVFSFRAPEFLLELVDRVSFGSADVLGEVTCRYVLLVDNFFYTAFKSANVALLILCTLLVLTLVNRAKSYAQIIRKIPLLTEEVLKELNKEFQRLQTDVKKVNDMFSFLFFLWYFEALVSAFNGFQYFMNGGLGVFSPIYAAFNFFQTPVAILIETYVASAIPINVEMSKSALLDVACGSRYNYMPLEFYILSKRLSGNRNGLTAAGFFLITRSICLSFIGFLVTYLIVLMSSRNSIY